jgi:tetratricopeptide (TPR) repeat protein
MTRVSVAAAVLAFSGAVLGQRGEPLAVGDPAPGIDVEAWVDSEAVTLKPDGTYLIMFWESVEADSKTAARLDRLHDLYGHHGLKIIVIAQDDVERLGNYSSRRRQNRGFALAADRRNSTQRAWVRKAGISDLPIAFIVGRGKVLHMGLPQDDDFENILVQVIAGRFDPRLQEQAQPKLDSARRARRVNNWRMAAKLYDEVIEMDSRVFAVIAIERLEMMYVDMDQKEEAYEFAEKTLIGDLFANDAGALRLLVIKIVEDPKFNPSERELEIAMTAAQRALELNGPRDPKALATAAVVHARRGNLKEAISLQTRAYFLARPEEKPTYKRVLANYRGAASRSSASSSPR